ncbi:cohesin domain-containing protein [Acetivibrio cellulolyticus]|uniref:cohesin domain-containing protein n=1 Tax=Acetivibrio cellulolyticus TaxID=35830 RepID=UPI0001E2CC62|nr:cohesin domain-containing protein [Acetivibrio cellulolyticus]
MYMSKIKKVISLVLCAFILCMMIQVERTEAATGFTVSVGSASGENGATIVVPVNFANVPSNGISTADMTITYDSSKLEYVKGEAGSIVTNASTNFGINKESDGKIKALFLDYTMSNGYISQSGVFLNLTFKVLGSGATTVSISGATFGDKNLSTISSTLNSGTINGGGTVSTPVNTSTVSTPTKTLAVSTPTKTLAVSTPTKTLATSTPVVVGSGFTVSVDSVSGNNGSTIVVPVSFANIPSSGISTADMTIMYDSSKLEYVSGEAGSIVTNASTNFGINKESDGKVKALFLDYTMSNGYISQSGVFANITFKALSSGTSTVSISGATFGDKNLNSVSAKFNSGTITVNGGGTVSTPVRTTPTQTTPVRTTPTPATSSGNFSVSYSQDEWNSGATVSISIKNNGSSPVNGWTVSFNYSGDQKITNAWSASYSQSGNSVTFSNLNYNAAIPAGGSVSFGFGISFTGKNSVPTNFTVNSTSVGSGTSTPVVTPTKTSTVVTPTKTSTVVTPVKTPVMGTGFTVSVDSVSGGYGTTIEVPIRFANVPSSGISTADMTITYDSSKLEYVSGAAGSIVTNAATNFAINKEAVGKIKVLFLDYTMSREYISNNGVFTNLTFKVLNSSATTVSISGATFGDKNLNTVSTTLIQGSINGGGTVSTPITTPVTSTPVSTPTPASSGDYSVSYSQNAWNSGATVSITIKNNSSSPLNNWTLNFNYSGDQKITNGWNCKYNQSGTSMTINGESYNASIPAGGSVSFGFNISFSGTNTAPTNFTVK